MEYAGTLKKTMAEVELEGSWHVQQRRASCSGSHRKTESTSIISARKATRHEQSIYTEGLNRHSGPETRTTWQGRTRKVLPPVLAGQPCRCVAARNIQALPNVASRQSGAREPSHCHRARPFAGERPKRIGEAARATKRALSRKLVPKSTRRPRIRGRSRRHRHIE